VRIHGGIGVVPIFAPSCYCTTDLRVVNVKWCRWWVLSCRTTPGGCEPSSNLYCRDTDDCFLPVIWYLLSVQLVLSCWGWCYVGISAAV